MSIEIVIPQVGEAIAEVTLVRWLKKEGDTVEQGEPLFEVDTDKAIVEVEAFANGTLAQIIVQEGSPVMPQQVVAILAPEGEVIASRRPVELNTAPITQPAEQKYSPLAQRIASDLGIDINDIQGSGPGGRVMAEDVKQYDSRLNREKERAAPPGTSFRAAVSPKARHLAKELGIDISRLKGTGVDGLITVEDVEAASPKISNSEDELQPFSKLRRTVAIRMAASKQQVPHFYLMVDVDMTEAQRLRAYCLDKLGWEKSATYTDIITRACALALASLPSVNVIFTETGIRQRDTVDVGIAVAVEDGLIAPVLPSTDRLSLKEISDQIKEVVQRTHAGRLRDSDLIQKSMVVSNLGMYDVDAFIAIIDMPDPMILAVGRVAERVIALQGQAAIRPMCTLTLSLDHRVLDGVMGARFLKLVKDYLENSFELLG